MEPKRNSSILSRPELHYSLEYSSLRSLTWQDPSANVIVFMKGSTMTDPLAQRIAIIGLGKLGGILARAFIEKGLIGKDQTVATVAHQSRADSLAGEFRFPVSTDNSAVVQNAEIVLLCVKPENVGSVCQEIDSALSPSHLLISVAASVPTQYIEDHLTRHVPVVRAMPNTPCQVGDGMTAICSGRFADSNHLNLTQKLFDTVGRTVILDEKHMDAVTGLSASGPAFIYVILESLAEAGVKVGLPRGTATLLAAQTALGAARVALETGSHPALLKDSVTTPAGCTIDGLLELEEGKLRVTLIKAVVKAVQRAGELLPEE